MAELNAPELCERLKCRNVATHSALSISDGEVRICEAHARSTADLRQYVQGSVKPLKPEAYEGAHEGQLPEERRLVSLEMTVSACPTFWEAVNLDGEKVEVRYRWGVLQVYVADELVWAKRIGSEYDGTLEDAKMLEHTGFVLLEKCQAVIAKAKKHLSFMTRPNQLILKELLAETKAGER